MKKAGTVKEKKSAPVLEGINKELAHKMLYFTVLTRKVEEKLEKLYLQGKLVGSLFRSLGQEGTAIGSATVLQPQDVLCVMIRDTGAIYVKGHTPQELFLNYMGKANGPTGGKDGNQHFGDLKRGTIACVSHMGAVIPVVAGAAWARNRLGQKAIGLTFVGDGGTSTGDFHESLNLASVLKAPLVLICEHNGWAYSTPTSSQMNIRDIVVRAQAYGIPGYMCDGNNMFEVYQFTKKAAEHARSGKGPVLIEVKTFRMLGHAQHDDGYYVPKSEKEFWAKRDPILVATQILKENDMLTDKELEALNERIGNEVEQAAQEALDAPMPSGSEAYRGVFEDESIIPVDRPWEKYKH